MLPQKIIIYFLTKIIQGGVLIQGTILLPNSTGNNYLIFIIQGGETDAVQSLDAYAQFSPLPVQFSPL